MYGFFSSIKLFAFLIAFYSVEHHHCECSKTKGKGEPAHLKTFAVHRKLKLDRQ